MRNASENALEVALHAFRSEANALSQAVAGLSEEEWHHPTRCEPWTVRELLGHVHVVIAWLPGMLAAAAPDRAEISAVAYYRPDERFDARTNAARIRLAQDHAARHSTGAALVDDFTTMWQLVDRLCDGEKDAEKDAERVVRTRHGDAMLLSQFLITRVVEVAVHGLDIADALGREPWLTGQAEDVLLELLAGPNWTGTLRERGWTRMSLLRRATGRQPMEESTGDVPIGRLTLGQRPPPEASLPA